MRVRKSAQWMSLVDERILEYLSEAERETDSEIQHSLAEIGTDLEHRHIFVAMRCDLLAQAGLLHFDWDSGEYSISNFGLEYLEGELDAAQLETNYSHKDGWDINFHQ